MSVSVATIYVNNEKILKIIDTGSNPQISNVKIIASKNTITAKFEGVGGSTNGFSCVLDCEIYNTDYTYTKVSDFELVITAPAPLEAFDGYATVGSNNTINLVYNPYNITTDKKYLTINCKDKTMQEDLNITFECSAPTIVQWDGAYEEIVSGFTLTLNCNDVLNSDTFMYSVDGGTTYNQFTSEVMTLENVTQIRFKTTASSHTYMKVGTTSGGGEITEGMQSSETENITLSSDTAYYVAWYQKVGGAD